MSDDKSDSSFYENLKSGLEEAIAFTKGECELVVIQSVVAEDNRPVKIIRKLVQVNELPVEGA